MPQRLLISILLTVIIGGLSKMQDFSAVVRALGKMHDEFARDFAGPLAIDDLLTLADAPMEMQSLSSGQPLIEDLPIQGMNESIASGNGPIRPLVNPARAQKLTAT